MKTIVKIGLGLGAAYLLYKFISSMAPPKGVKLEVKGNLPPEEMPPFDGGVQELNRAIKTKLPPDTNAKYIWKRTYKGACPSGWTYDEASGLCKRWVAGN